ncbi:MAG: S49 family peptidase [Giesbergeria sp.]|uniref:S49 family peptidase n=1 Tax=Giesbergeria sp. TaxID=2818473 RepID=UPI002607C066|nr:S49 family peptidase [Giesbergeria sp.]MDD2610656.1 S49 family peptidase [Giesbergeria sp.]
MSHLSYPHVAARLFNTPLLLHPQKLDAIIAGIGPRLLGGNQQIVLPEAVVQEGIQALAPELFSTQRGVRSDRGYRVVDGVAVVSAMGALVHRTRMEADSTMLIGYNDLAADVEHAMDSSDVHAVLQVYDSPGGEVAGAFEHAQRVFDMRGRKPMIAIADGMAASAAYLAASAADEVVLTNTSYVGSIGVVMRHVDFSRALANDGIHVTSIFAGAHKVDGNPYEPLPASVRAALQADINGLYTMFVQAVSRHLGMAEAAVRATQAQTYMGEAAITAGLARRISTTDALIAELAAQRTRIHPSTHHPSSSKANAMQTPGTTPAGQPTAPVASTTPTAPAAVSFSQTDLDKARAEAATAERTRVSAILAHPAAATHPALAQQCIATGLSAEQAAGILGAVPQAAAPAASKADSQFAQHMQALGNPQVSGVEPPAHSAENNPGLIQNSWASAFGTSQKKH